MSRKKAPRILRRAFGADGGVKPARQGTVPCAICFLILLNQFLYFFNITKFFYSAHLKDNGKNIK